MRSGPSAQGLHCEGFGEVLEGPGKNSGFEGGLM